MFLGNRSRKRSCAKLAGKVGRTRVEIKECGRQPGCREAQIHRGIKTWKWLPALHFNFGYSLQITLQQIKIFGEELKTFQEKFKEEGPGNVGTDLEHGQYAERKI
jgi:hypothetical protein